CRRRRGARRDGGRIGPACQCRQPAHTGGDRERTEHMTGRSLFVLGGARSGKSRYAQARAEAIAGRHIFIATAQAHDAEMRDRIARHRADRDERWQTVEAPHDLAAAIDAANGADAIVLVDCLTIWISNLMLAEADTEAATR